MKRKINLKNCHLLISQITRIIFVISFFFISFSLFLANDNRFKCKFWCHLKPTVDTISWFLFLDYMRSKSCWWIKCCIGKEEAATLLDARAEPLRALTLLRIWMKLFCETLFSSVVRSTNVVCTMCVSNWMWDELRTFVTHFNLIFKNVARFKGRGLLNLDKKMPVLVIIHGLNLTIVIRISLRTMKSTLSYVVVSNQRPTLPSPARLGERVLFDRKPYSG